MWCINRQFGTQVESACSVALILDISRPSTDLLKVGFLASHHSIWFDMWVF